ncbi:MAG: metabolite traffic protein EboE [Planctomycetota bacterium]
MPQPRANGPLLTYCGNVHAARSVDEFLAGLAAVAVPVRDAARAAGRPFGLGAWWPAPVAKAIARDEATQQRVRSALHELDLSLWTLNVFPYGDFHEAVVKEAVYAPDWSTEDRLLYTRDCAEAAAALVPSGTVVPLSTLPLGFRPGGADPSLLRVMARNLARAASHLHGLCERTGVHCVLALEPEPFCLLETAASAADFLEQWLFDEGAFVTVPERTLREHLGICVDLCHLFVVGEDPLAVLADLRARGIAVPKIQVSSCLEVRAPSGLDELLAFDESRYLHQSVVHGGPRALDLGGVAARRAEFERALANGPLRTHYHMPIFWDRSGAFGSTRALLERALDGIRELPSPPLCEVETYTWSVLTGELCLAPLHERIARELDFAANRLGV